MNTREFLNSLRPEGDLMVLVAIAPDPPKKVNGKAPPHITAHTFDLPGDMPGALRWAEERNVYYCPNPPKRRMGKKPAKADMAAGLFMWADIDAKDQKQATYEARHAHLMNGVCSGLTSGDNPAIIVVDGGHGLQPLYRLAEPMTDLDAFSKLNKQAGESLEGPGTNDPSRVLRLPGTLNHPSKKKRVTDGYPAEPVPATVLHSGGPTYTSPRCKRPSASIQRRLSAMLRATSSVPMSANMNTRRACRGRRATRPPGCSTTWTKWTTTHGCTPTWR